MNYIGCKYTLLPFLSECIDKIVKEKQMPLVFCDIFAGTGTVGAYFKQKGYSIISNDLQYYSYVLNRQYIGNHIPITFDGLLDIIQDLSLCQKWTDRVVMVCAYLDQCEGNEGFIFKNYCSGGTNGERMYFTDYNGKKCDAIRFIIEKWKMDGRVNDNEYYYLLATLLENVDKVANTASVYGAFLKHFKKSALKPLIMKPINYIVNDINHKVFCEDANKLIKTISMDILYLDPPYNQRQYSSNYHLLETISRYDNPTISGKTGLRNYELQKSNYCSSNRVKEVFKDLIMNAKTKYIFLSYNNEGLMSFEDIKKIMSIRGEYGCFERNYTRFQADKTNARNHKANQTIEYLHYVICE